MVEIDNTAVAAIAALTVALIGILIAAFTMSGNKKTDGPQEEREPVVQVGGQAQRRMRRRQRPEQQVQQVLDDEDDGEDGDGGEDDEVQGRSRADRIRQKRLDQARMREEARLEEEAMREAKDSKLSAYELRRRQKEEEREAQEQAQQEEIRQAQEETRQRQEEEAQKWMDMICVDQAGNEGSEETLEELQQRLGDTIKRRKTVVLEDLAAEFKMPTSQLVKHLEALEDAGEVTGVLDDRGKFFYLTKEELQAVADFIRKQGRVAIYELALKSNTLMDLEAKEDVKGDTISFDELAAGGVEARA